MDDTRDEVGEILAGMTGGRTGTAGGVSSPVPPAADWPGDSTPRRRRPRG